MTPTTSEREARELLAREYERDGSANIAALVRNGEFDRGCNIRAIIAALARQEAQQECPKCGGTGGERWHEADGSENGARCDACDGFGTQQEAQGAVAVSYAQLASFANKCGYTVEEAAGTISLLNEVIGATPPAPVDVRVALPKVTFKNVQRGDCGKYPDGTGWGHAWSAPIVEIERADWDRFIALLSGQPAGVDESTWREGWAFAYSGTRLYGDDGELQDNSEQPLIDWRRDSATEILAKIRERANRKIAALGGGGGR